jgi:AraC-like DNA-binding protein
VTRLRLERACQMLASTHETIKSIAHSVGYSNPRYFKKKFTRQYGMPPSAYRKRAQLKRETSEIAHGHVLS